MKTSKLKHLSILIFSIWSLAACTQSKNNKKFDQLNSGEINNSNLYEVAEVGLDGNEMVALQMVQNNGAIYLTGKPFGFAKWDISADPENPYLSFAAFVLNAGSGLYQMSPGFLPNGGRFFPDNFAKSGLAISGSYAFTSGDVGMSVISMLNANQPVEVGKHPFQLPTSTSDVKDSEGAFSHKVLLVNPLNPSYLYGFHEQDFIYTLRVSYNQKEYININGKNYDNGPQITPVKKESYGNGPVCCVMGGATIGNKVLIAFKTSLWALTMKADGSLSAPTISNLLQANDVKATSDFIYVHHVPSFSSSTGLTKPEGIYVYDSSFNEVAYLPISPQKFAVSDDNQYLYANLDNASVRIYRMTWFR